MNKVIMVIIGLVIMGAVIFSYDLLDFNEKAIPIWEKDKEKITKKAQITGVGIISETCNEIVYEISYVNVKNKGNRTHQIGGAELLVKNKDYNGRSTLRGDSSIMLDNGNGKIKYKRWITPEKITSKTNKVWFQMDTVNNNDDDDTKYVDFVEIEREKTWDNSCNYNEK
jgi:negative regulator of sigma E activity